METDIIEALTDLGYAGPLLDETALLKAIDNAPKSVEFSKLINTIAEELKQLCKLEETVNAINDSSESSVFLLELSSFLKELGCPYSKLVMGHLSSRFQNKDDALLLLDYLISELMAARMVNVDKPKDGTTMDIVMQESPTAKDLKDVLIALNFNKPPPNITVDILFSKLEAKLKDTIQKEGQQLVGKPLFNKTITDKQWKELEASYAEMLEDYSLRRETLITRLECTIQSFEWSDRLKDKKDLIQAAYRPRRAPLRAKPSVRLSDFLAARTSLLHIEKTSSAEVRKNTKSDVNRVLIGRVPDRGGRPNEQQPPPPEMPSWQQRTQVTQNDIRTDRQTDSLDETKTEVYIDRKKYTVNDAQGKTQRDIHTDKQKAYVGDAVEIPSWQQRAYVTQNDIHTDRQTDSLDVKQTEICTDRKLDTVGDVQTKVRSDGKIDTVDDVQVITLFNVHTDRQTDSEDYTNTEVNTDRIIDTLHDAVDELKEVVTECDKQTDSTHKEIDMEGIINVHIGVNELREILRKLDRCTDSNNKEGTKDNAILVKKLKDIDTDTIINESCVGNEQNDKRTDNVLDIIDQNVNKVARFVIERLREDTNTKEIYTIDVKKTVINNYTNFKRNNTNNKENVETLEPTTVTRDNQINKRKRKYELISKDVIYDNDDTPNQFKRRRIGFMVKELKYICNDVINHMNVIFITRKQDKNVPNPQLLERDAIPHLNTQSKYRKNTKTVEQVTTKRCTNLDLFVKEFAEKKLDAIQCTDLNNNEMVTVIEKADMKTNNEQCNNNEPLTLESFNTENEKSVDNVESLKLIEEDSSISTIDESLNESVKIEVEEPKYLRLVPLAKLLRSPKTVLDTTDITNDSKTNDNKDLNVNIGAETPIISKQPSKLAQKFTNFIGTIKEPNLKTKSLNLAQKFSDFLKTIEESNNVTNNEVYKIGEIIDNIVQNKIFTNKVTPVENITKINPNTAPNETNSRIEKEINKEDKHVQSNIITDIPIIVIDDSDDEKPTSNVRAKTIIKQKQIPVVTKRKIEEPNRRPAKKRKLKNKKNAQKENTVHKVAIVPDKYPEIYFPKKSRHLVSDLLNEKCASSKEIPYLKIDQYHIGAFTITCYENRALFWLKTYVENCTMSNGKKVKIVDFDTLEIRVKMSWKCRYISDKHQNNILERLKSFKNTLFTQHWTVESVVINSENIEREVRMDVVSADIIKKCNYQIKFRGGERHIFKLL